MEWLNQIEGLTISSAELLLDDSFSSVLNAGGNKPILALFRASA